MSHVSYSGLPRLLRVALSGPLCSLLESNSVRDFEGLKSVENFVRTTILVFLQGVALYEMMPVKYDTSFMISCFTPY